MKVAIPVFRSRVSPVFDWCKHILLVRIQSGREETREEIEVGGLVLSERVERLINEGIDLIVCGAMTHFSSQLFESRGIEVIPWVSGEIEDVIYALANGGLAHERFLMPGGRQRKCGAVPVKKRKRRGH